MAMHPRWTPSHPRARSTRRTARLTFRSAALAVGVVGSLAVAPHTANHEGLRNASLPNEAAAPRIAMVSATEPVVLRRHRGVVNGDGQTVYLANHTRFRPAGSVSLPPQVRARSWVVVDLSTGRLLGKHRPRVDLPQASTMKLLTAVTAARTLSREPHKVTRFEAHQTCTCAGLRAGRLYRFRTLLEGMLLPSGNDAAEAIAGSHPQGRYAFYQAMNQNAQRLGATDTVARNASGLTATGSHSSARDLVILLRAAMRYPLLTDVLGERSARITTVAGRFGHTVWRGTDYVNLYANSLGKSGYTTPAKNTLVVATRISGHQIAVATMGAPGGYSTSGARALTLWAADNFDGLMGVGTLPHS